MIGTESSVGLVDGQTEVGQDDQEETQNRYAAVSMSIGTTHLAPIMHIPFQQVQARVWQSAAWDCRGAFRPGARRSDETSARIMV